MGNNKDEKDPCTRLNYREQRLKKWEEIYKESQRVILENLETPFGHLKVNAACTAITTASREIQIIERVMKTLGELEGDEFGFDFTLPKYNEEMRLN